MDMGCGEMDGEEWNSVHTGLNAWGWTEWRNKGMDSLGCTVNIESLEGLMCSSRCVGVYSLLCILCGLEGVE